MLPDGGAGIESAVEGEPAAPAVWLDGLRLTLSRLAVFSLGASQMSHPSEASIRLNDRPRGEKVPPQPFDKLEDHPTISRHTLT